MKWANLYFSAIMSIFYLPPKLLAANRATYSKIHNSQAFVDYFSYTEKDQFKYGKKNFEKDFRKFAIEKLPDFLKLSPTDEQWNTLSESNAFKGRSIEELRGIANGKLPAKKSFLSCFSRAAQKLSR